MSNEWPEKFPEDRKPGTPGVVKVLIGCGVAGLLGLIVACGGLIFALRYGINQVNQLTAEFESKGYAKTAGQVIQVSTSPSTPTVYLCQLLQIKGDINVDIAAVVQVMEVDGRIDGDIDFTGQLLHIKPNAVVTGNIRVKGAQQIIIEGQLLGEITGDYANIDDRRRPPAVQAPQAEATGGAATVQEAAPAVQQ